MTLLKLRLRCDEAIESMPESQAPMVIVVDLVNTRHWLR
jgi:hypothetical protein